ncbi:hypothetical protein COCSUDRAFT_59470 [Coccomyxa subellipsoidea C-169]|uniref:Uncharacterized protein n=1 Tax=Coccomyxa subellipsoidea (strain C-169) TaxID=574566 RepID=I0Z8K8_COCSC|nr:hypothetical protein COCSUDRAFT_59470 [Coccomyxa subellipsoidea C-169]EIE26977.1 hypothetical protein COCSUDRAFT_59470 [Coccomyxa subellipsoidea C-169]|eukprot:XP_005651521.1 hypothetical protein COCSUDRAFT_59470 [Coccomyxa subellipsoidea C-169]
MSANTFNEGADVRQLRNIALRAHFKSLLEAGICPKDAEDEWHRAKLEVSEELPKIPVIYKLNREDFKLSDDFEALAKARAPLIGEHAGLTFTEKYRDKLKPLLTIERSWQMAQDLLKAMKAQLKTGCFGSEIGWPYKFLERQLQDAPASLQKNAENYQVLCGKYGNKRVEACAEYLRSEDGTWLRRVHAFPDHWFLCDKFHCIFIAYARPGSLDSDACMCALAAINGAIDLGKFDSDLEVSPQAVHERAGLLFAPGEGRLGYCRLEVEWVPALFEFIIEESFVADVHKGPYNVERVSWGRVNADPVWYINASKIA